MKNNIRTSNSIAQHKPNSRDYWLECAKRGLTEEPMVKSALQQLSVNPSDSDCHGIVLQAISAHDTGELLHPEPFRRTNPKGGMVDGAIRLGVVRHTSAIWGLSANTLTTHVLISSRSGGGKTCLIKSIIKQLFEKK